MPTVTEREQWPLGSEVREVESLAQEYGFRMPRLDESLESYERELMQHINSVVLAEVSR